MRKILFFAVGILFALSSGSCEKDDTPSKKRLLPAKIISMNYTKDDATEISHLGFEYDEQNRITKIQSTGSYWYKKVFTYDGDIIKVNGEEELLIKNGSYIEVLRNQRWTEITIPIDDNLRSLNNTYDAKGNVIEYFDENIEIYEQSGVNITCKYDRQNGIFRYVNASPWFLTDYLSDYPYCELSRFSLYNNRTEYLIEYKMKHKLIIQYNEYNYPVEIIDGMYGYRIEYIEAN